MSRTSLFAGGFVMACALAAGTRADAPTTQPNSTPAPTTQPAAPPQDILDIELLKLQLAFEGAYDHYETRFDARDYAGITYHQTNRNWRLEETLGMETRGTLLGPRVVEFDAGIRGGLTQEWFREKRDGPDLSEDASGSLFEYDLSMTLFPRGKLSGTAYAKRHDSRVPRAFQPSLDRTMETYGAGLFFNDRRLPMRLTFEHVWDELTSRTRELYDDEQRGRDKFRYEATWQIDPHHAVRLDYEYDDRSEEYSGSDTRFDTTRNYLTLNHTLRFGPEHRSSWETIARFQDESGDLARDTTEVSSRLRLQHTKHFATNYAAQYLRDSYFDLTTETYRGEIGLTHRYADALTTTMQLYGLQQQAENNADFNEWGGLVNLSFAKDNTLGRLSANLSYNHNNIDTRDGQRHGVVLSESVTFRDPLPAYLAHTDIVPSTIVVTNASRSRTYLPGRDFLIVRLGRYIALSRVPTGAIPDRATVLVTYVYRVYNNYDLSRHRVDFRVQQAFKMGLTPYYAASIQDEDLEEPRFLRYRARNVNRHRIGATFRQRRWSVGGEYEYNDDAIDPYQAVHFNGDVVLWQAARNQLDGKGNASRFWFDGSDGLESRNTTLVDVGLSYRHLLARSLEAQATAMYRYEHDSLYGNTHGVDLSGALEWQVGYFSVRLEAEYDMLDLPGSRDNGAAVWLKLKRDIPVIAKRPRR